MANEIRLRSNNQSGTITDNPLAIGATTVNSAQFALLPTVDATNHLMLILDPLGVSGTPEIVKVTAHTAASTTCTIVRAQEGSVARSFVFNTTWFHGPTVADYNFTDRAALSTNRPTSGLFAGQTIYETDTKKMMVYNGTDWNPNQAGGQLGYSATFVNQAGITDGVDLTNLTSTVTVGTNRRIKITGCIPSMLRTAGTVTFVGMDIREGATVLTGMFTAVPNTAGGTIAQIVTTPTAGAHTYKLTGRTDGTVTLQAALTFPSFILVEDIGAA